jgi:hypothetical protein
VFILFIVTLFISIDRKRTPTYLGTPKENLVLGKVWSFMGRFADKPLENGIAFINFLTQLLS